MNYWLVKSDPDTYGWKELVRDGSTRWDGVRNFSARNHLKAMKKGDQVLFYHSQTDKAVVGITKVLKESYPDPTAKEGPWLAVDLAAVKPIKNPVTLEKIKSDKRLSEIYLVRQGRLSVMPLNEAEFDIIVEMGN